jgi:hypothetical protein
MENNLKSGWKPVLTPGLEASLKESEDSDGDLNMYDLIRELEARNINIYGNESKSSP